MSNGLNNNPNDAGAHGLHLPFVRREDGLLVPAWYAAREEAPDHAPTPWIAEFTVTTAGWHASVPRGEPPTLTAVIARLRRYSLRQLCMMVSRISVALHRTPDADIRTTQDAIIDNHLGVGTSAKLRLNVAASLGDEYNPDALAFLHERQLLNALKLAFLCIDVDAADTGESSAPFIEALLMLSDLIDEPHAVRGADDEHARAELYVFANTLFHEAAGNLRDLVRSHHLYIAPGLETMSAPDAVDLREMLSRATGFAPETAWALLFAISAAWRAKSEDDLAQGRLMESRSQYLSTLTSLSTADADRAFAMACRNADDLQREIQARYPGGASSVEALRTFDFLPFEQRPLVAFGDSAVCISIPLLQRLTTTALQHRFLDTTIFSRGERDAFLRTRGRLFERYVTDVLSRTFGNRLLRETDLQPLAGDAKVCDGIVIYEDALLLIEAKAAAVRLDARNMESYQAYRETIGGAVREAADQLESTARLADAGRFRSLGIEPERIRQVYPIVALFEQPVTPLSYRAIREIDLAGHPLQGRTDAGRAAPFQLLHVKEVEMWELAAESGANVRDLLWAKVSDEVSTEMSFHHFCYLRREPFLDRRGAWYAERYLEIMHRVRELYAELGLPLTSDDEPWE